MANMNISSPWILYYRKLQTLFRNDPGVTILYDNDRLELTVLADTGSKADALQVLLPSEKVFGNVVLRIEVKALNSAQGTSENFYADAFEGNAALAYINERDLCGMKIRYVVFRKEVVQYFTDDLGDIHGFHSTLYENLARDVLEADPGTFYCTDTEGMYLPGVPHGHWP